MCAHKKKHTEILAEQKAERSGESTEQRHRSFFGTLLDIFPLIGPDIAFLPPHSSQEQTHCENSWELFWREKKNKNRIEYV